MEEFEVPRIDCFKLEKEVTSLDDWNIEQLKAEATEACGKHGYCVNWKLEEKGWDAWLKEPKLWLIGVVYQEDLLN